MYSRPVFVDAETQPESAYDANRDVAEDKETLLYYTRLVNSKVQRLRYLSCARGDRCIVAHKHAVDELSTPAM